MDDKITTYIKTELANEPVAFIEPGEDLVGSGLVDSLGMMRLIAFIEKQFEIQIGPDDMTVENFGTLQSIEAFLKNKIGRDTV